MAPKGTSRHTDADHTLTTLARDVDAPNTRCAASNASLAIPDWTVDLMASAGARTMDPTISPMAPESRYSNKMECGWKRGRSACLVDS
mmetsp:Transcript_8623/g.14995  ORF Transcript_8623/g.14995 Transcript_8623/m.14995 type:complete len:88 (+) Transcript_8623:785-1048(+)